MRGGKAAAAAVRQAEAEVEASRREHGDDAPETVKALGKLAAAYFRAQDFTAAKATSDTVYSIRRERLGEERALPSLNIAAACLYEQGEFESARDLQARILRATETEYGSDSKWTAQAMVQLAVTLSRLGDDDGARMLQGQAIEIYDEVLGPNDPATKWAQGKLRITELSTLWPWFRLVALAVVVVAVGLLLGFGEYAFGIGFGLGGFLLAEGSRDMRQDRRINPRPTVVTKVRGWSAVVLCGGGAAALLVLEGHNLMADGVAGLLAAFGFIGIVMNAVASRFVARRTM